MKFRKIEDLQDGWWCRLADGDIWTHRNWTEPQMREICGDEMGYEDALLDMGAEWFPPIPEGYRLATAEDRKGEKPMGYMIDTYKGWTEQTWPGPEKWWDDTEYIVPKEEPKPKVYTVGSSAAGYNGCLWIGDNFQPGDRVEVRKVEDWLG